MAISYRTGAERQRAITARLVIVATALAVALAGLVLWRLDW
jgi:hypothetical protein